MGIGYIRSGLEVLSQIHGEKCWPLVSKVSPCEEACPIHMDIPSYIMALAQGQVKEALDVIRETNPFPSICGRVCHHPCEEACNRALVDKPVAIEWIKRFIGEYELKNNGLPKQVERTRSERVAIVGSGPAGLTAAHDLVKKGYGVNVYEALPVAGGMLAAGIPEFVLPQKIVQAEVDYIKALGVNIKTNIRIGKDLGFDELRDQGFKAILLATGAWKSASLNIPGADLKGVMQALTLLRDVKLGKKIFLKGTVAVIGGGNVAIDAARTALRLGASEVILACLESKSKMPAFPWEIETARREGVQIKTSLAPQRFAGNVVGKVNQIVFRKVAKVKKDQDGRISWTLKKGPKTEVLMDVNTVIIAIGQVPDPGLFGQDLEINPENLSTSVPGLFAAGDLVKAPGTVVESIAAGHMAAESISRYLNGEELARNPSGEKVEVFTIKKEMVPAFLPRKDRWDMPSLSPKDAVRSFSEPALGYTEWQAREEARRCLNCRMCGNCIFEHGQLCFETSTRLL